MFLLQRRLVWGLLQMEEKHGETFISQKEKENLMDWMHFQKTKHKLLLGELERPKNPN